MKCRKCGQPAVINMRHHKLTLCEDCFLAWVALRVQHTIERFRMFTHDEKILVAVSGGKDSLALWHILNHLGYATEGIYIDLSISEGEYSRQSRDKVRKFAGQHGDLPYRVVDVEALYGRSVPEQARARRRGGKVCSVCGLVKRHIMNRVAHEGGFSAVATGHNLDDEVAVLLQNTLNWEVGYLGRQAPVLPERQTHLSRKVKPLCLMYEREMAAYALILGIDYIYAECPFSVGAKTIFYKQLLNQLEARSLGSKLRFYTMFLKEKTAGNMRFLDLSGEELGPCRRCGQPTSAAELCAFCRLWDPPVQNPDEESRPMGMLR